MHKIDNSDKRRVYGKQVKHAASLNKPMDSRKAERYFSRYARDRAGKIRDRLKWEILGNNAMMLDSGLHSDREDKYEQDAVRGSSCAIPR